MEGEFTIRSGKVRETGCPTDRGRKVKKDFLGGRRRGEGETIFGG